MFFHRCLYVYQRVTLFFGLDYGGLVPLWWSTVFYDRGGTILGDHKGILILIWGWHDMVHFRIAAYIMLNSFNSHVFSGWDDRESNNCWTLGFQTIRFRQVYCIDFTYWCLCPYMNNTYYCLVNTYVYIYIFTVYCYAVV